MPDLLHYFSKEARAERATAKVQFETAAKAVRPLAKAMASMVNWQDNEYRVGQTARMIVESALEEGVPQLVSEGQSEKTAREQILNRLIENGDANLTLGMIGLHQKYNMDL